MGRFRSFHIWKNSNAEKSCTKFLWHIGRENLRIAYMPKNLEVRTYKLFNLLTQKLTFALTSCIFQERLFGFYFEFSYEFFRVYLFSRGAANSGLLFPMRIGCTRRPLQASLHALVGTILRKNREEKDAEKNLK